MSYLDNFHAAENNQRADVRKIININKCKGEISDCEHLNDLAVIMEEYMESNLDFDKMDIRWILNNFLHLISEHDDDDEFESIYNKICATNCNILHCNVFLRNHRNRNKIRKNDKCFSELFKTTDDTIIAKMQILDKIHCHYVHCYDIGHRLTSKERETISTQKRTNDLIKLLSLKHKEYHRSHEKLQRFTKSKFVSTIDTHTISQNQKLDTENIQMYDFGIEFEYDYDIKNKYNSFKKELTSNKSNKISLAQFNIERNKATLYFNSTYCQQTMMFVNKYRRKEHFVITIQHILSLLIYCNYDVLQHEFSKTYRAIYKNESKQSIIKRHSEFYFLGKYLKEAVHRLGLSITQGNVISFYHGISEYLLFPLGERNEIKVPLSTSSQIAVAVNFTAYNNGLIVEFVDHYHSTRNVNLSVSWCSDYGNESEHLFVQNRASLQFDNIIDTRIRYEFGEILEGINLLNNLYVSYEKCDERKEKVAIKLIKHETKMEEWKDLHIYAQRLFHEYCTNRDDYARINWKGISAEYPLIRRLFSSGKYDGVNIGFWNALHPKLKRMHIYYMQICPLLLEDILNHFTANKTSMIDSVEFFKSVEIPDHRIDGIVEKYKNEFEHIGFSLTYQTMHSCVSIKRL
eukprot:318097_1